MLARELVPEWGGWPKASTILDLLDAGRTQAYEMLERLRALLSTLVGTPGRPPSAKPDKDVENAVLLAVRDFVLAHPGCACLGAERCVYSEHFRHFVIGLRAPGQPAETMSMADLSHATTVPVGTLKEWLASRSEAPPDAPTDPPDWVIIRSTNLQLVIRLWKQWKGSLKAFCCMLCTEYRLRYSSSYISGFLEALGLRKRKRGRPVEAPWSSNTLRMFFPGAQWFGDGTEIGMVLNGEVFVFNLEAIIDAASNAMVGIAVSDTEDEEAVRKAFMDALETVGTAPVGITLDNKPCNHSPEAKDGMPGAIVLRSTLGRGQSKAPVEGAFGLFQQAMPPLEIAGSTQREIARAALYLIFTAWFRGRNGRPRKRLGGLTPVQAYDEARPSPEDFQRVMAHFQQLEKRQEQMRATREARLDPVRIALLTQGLEELGIPDPDRHLTLALASYSRDAIAYGLSIYRTKRDRGTLPPDADGRYLGGIIRNHDTKLEVTQFSSHILEQRIRLRDLSLRPLQHIESQVRATTPSHDLPQAFADRALDATYTIDFTFWANAAAAALSSLPAQCRAPLYTALCRRIAASFRIDRERREDLIGCLAGVVPP